MFRNDLLAGKRYLVTAGGYLQNGASFTHLRELGDADWRAMRESIRATDARDLALRKA